MTSNEKWGLFVWKETHAELLLWEVLINETYKFLLCSKERGAVWRSIATHLEELRMKFSQIFVRQRFNKILQKKLKNCEQVEWTSSTLNATKNWWIYWKELKWFRQNLCRQNYVNYVGKLCRERQRNTRQSHRWRNEEKWGKSNGKVGRNIKMAT